MNFRRRPDDLDRQTADWLARLHADDRTPADEDRFRTWIGAEPAHRDAFERASAIWTAVGGLKGERGAFAELEPEVRSGKTMSRRAVLAGGAAVLAASGVTMGWQTAYAGVYRTDVGEQRRVRFSDGTRALMDTDTSIRYREKGEIRLLALMSGQLDLEIASDPRPFVIDLGFRQAIANDARIDVRRIGEAAQVTAISGAARIATGSGRAISLSPGSRIALAEGAQDRVDRPELEDLTAWQSGRLAFRDEPLGNAVAEMNRYSERPLIVDDLRIAAMRISGIYRAGDPEGFAQSLSLLLPVRVDTRTGEPVRIVPAI